MADFDFVGFVFTTSDYSQGWNGVAFVDDVKEWRKWSHEELDDFGDTQYTLSALDLDYETCAMYLHVAEITEGPDAGKWAVYVHFEKVNLALNESLETSFD